MQLHAKHKHVLFILGCVVLGTFVTLRYSGKLPTHFSQRTSILSPSPSPTLPSPSPSPTHEPHPYLSPKKTQLGDFDAYHYSLNIFLPEYNVKSEDYYFEANGNYFFVNHRYIAGTEDQHLETIKTMKSSLKFGERDNCTFERMLEGETLWDILNELDAKNPFQMVYTDY